MDAVAAARPGGPDALTSGGTPAQEYHSTHMRGTAARKIETMRPATAAVDEIVAAMAFDEA